MVDRMRKLYLVLNIYFLLLIVYQIDCVSKPSAPKILNLKPYNITILSKNIAIFECNVFSSQISHITWKKNQKKISENSKKYKIINGPNLSYLKIADLNHLNYTNLQITCTAENDFGKAEANSYLNIIPERDKPKSFPQISITNPKSVEPDSLFRIECNVTNIISPMHLQWYQLGRPINVDNKKYFLNSTRSSDGTFRQILTVKGLPLPLDISTETQEIDYLCIATNNYGSYAAETSVLLRNRFMPPVFIYPKRSVFELDYGASINITCQANGSPKPSVKWLESNLVIDLTADASSSSSATTNVDILRIKFFNQTKSYACRAHNSFGLVLYNVTIFLRDTISKAEAPVDLKATTIYYNTIELEWKAGDQSEVSFYVIKYNEEQQDEYNDYSGVDLVDYNANQQLNKQDSVENEFYYYYENTTNTKYRLQNRLKPFTFYVFQVIAVNPLGESQESDSIRVQTAASKPGNVRNIRYTYQDDAIFTIKCDEPNDPNGNLISYKIYYTSQVLDPIDKWSSIIVPINDMPYPLVLLNSAEINDYKSYFMRMSAINAEVGEGPYSNIIELKKTLNKLEMPQDFNFKQIEPSVLQLKWSYNVNILKHIRQTSDYAHAGDDKATGKNKFDNFYFYLYLNKTVVDNEQSTTTPQALHRTHISASTTPYLIISATKAVVMHDHSHNTFTHNLTSLLPNSQYIFYLSARYELLESSLAGPLVIQTPVPGVPQDIKVTKIQRTSFDVEWKPPRSNEAYGQIRGYQINYIKLNSQTTSDNDMLIQQQQALDAVKVIKLRDTSKLKHTIKDLEPGSTYKLQIFAFNNRGDGTRSPPFLVTTLDDLPSKPENLRAQIYNDQLHIQWSKPKNNFNQIDGGYRLFFNNEQFDLDSDQNELILKKPKWDYNQQYDIRVSAKSSKNNSVYGEEAIYRIKTQESSKKLSLIVDKRTSTSAQLKWQQIKFDETNELSKSYRIEYYLKEEPLNIKNIPEIDDKTEYTLANLQPNSVYIVQLVAYPSNLDTSLNEETIIYFQTLNSDIAAPKNLKIDRLDLERINLKWEQPDVTASNENIKSYKVYISEFSQALNEHETAAFTWEPIEMNDYKNTDLIMKGLNLNKNYAFKVVAIDDKDREGTESNVVFLYRTTDDQLDQLQGITDQKSSPQSSYQLNSDLGQARDIEILEVSSVAVKFAWLPPINTQLSHERLKRLSYRISYIDKPKTFKDYDGQLRTYTSSNQFNVLVPPRDDLTMRITWLITGLSADTVYEFNVSTVLDQHTQGPPVQRTIRTKRDKPSYVDPPQIKELFEDNTVLVQMGNGSEKNGPISRYWLIVVPQTEFNKYDDAYENDLNELLRLSLSQLNQTQDSYHTNDEHAFIAAEFESKDYPLRFLLGDGRLYGRFLNRLLTRGIDYKLFTIAFTDTENVAQNRVGLDKLFTSISRGGGGAAAAAAVDKADKIISNLYTFSQYSDTFNTKAIENAPAMKKPMEYQHYLWILGASGALVFVFIIVIIAIALKTRKKNCGLFGGGGGGGKTSHHQIKFSDDLLDDMDGIDNNKATLIPQTQTNTTTSNASSTIGNGGVYAHMNGSGGGGGGGQISPPLPPAPNMHQTATLGRHHIQQSLNSSTIGLLTTVPQQQQQHHQMTPNASQTTAPECLYTSIDAAQRQHLLSYSNTLNGTSGGQAKLSLFSNFDPHTGTVNSTSTALYGTVQHTSHYDPMTDLKRLNSQMQQQQLHASSQQRQPLRFDELSGFIEVLKQNQNEKYQIEYESIDPSQQFTWDNSTKEYNRHKNRYANVIAYDHSRVVLQPLYDQQSHTPVSGTDYINANYIDGYTKKNAYIATQGPLPSTYTDFWRMVWEQNCAIIVMMTKLEERNRLKCDQYWPSKGMDVYGGLMQVTLVDCTELATYTIRTFILARLGSNEQKREIKHFQFTAWPDHGVPEHSTAFLMFLRRVNATISIQSMPEVSGPIVVHCSAGVGRTGCFIVADAMMERVQYEKTVDIYGYVTQLRAQRNYMVQTEDQYQFCYDATLELIQSGQTEVHARNLYQHLEALLQTVDDNSPLTEMELEYKRLTNAKAPHTKFQSANMPCNKYKNRLVNILPYETTRVCLSVQQQKNGQSDGTDYINANFIDGYKFCKAYIATQAPLQETVDDFWRMLWETNSTIVVMLTKLREMGREKCAQYWPSECSVRYQYFVIDPIAEYNMSQYILREFKITDARDGQSRTIRQFQYCDWPEQGVPKSGESIIELIGQVHKTKEQFGQVGPITVHCSAGVGRTGVFITLSVVLERMRYEGMIDVYNTVKMLRTQRPAMVQTEDQYQFCYRAALEYLGSFDNFEA